MVNLVYVVSFITLSILGLLNSGYLLYKHYTKKQKPLICPMNHDCSKVTESKWSHIFLIRNEFLGVLFFLGMLTLILIYHLFSVMDFGISILIFIMSSIGLLFSIFLVLVQAFILKDYCFYCLISAIITFLLFLNSIAFIK